MAALDPQAERVLALDAVYPQQFFRRAVIDTPEKRLMLAVMEDAITCYLRPQNQPTSNRSTSEIRRHRADAYREFILARNWINERYAMSRAKYFSYEFICAVLRFDAKELRAKIEDVRVRGGWIRKPHCEFRGSMTTVREKPPSKAKGRRITARYGVVRYFMVRSGLVD